MPKHDHNQSFSFFISISASTTSPSNLKCKAVGFVFSLGRFVFYADRQCQILSSNTFNAYLKWFIAHARGKRVEISGTIETHDQRLSQNDLLQLAGQWNGEFVSLPFI